MKHTSLMDDISLPGLQVLMETIWVYTVMIAISGLSAAGRPYFGFLQILSLPACAAWLTRICLLVPGKLTGRGLLFSGATLFLLTWLCWIGTTVSTPYGKTWLDALAGLGDIGRGAGHDSAVSSWLIGLCLASRGIWIGFARSSVKRQAQWFLAGTGILAFLFTALPNIGRVGQGNEIRSLLILYFMAGLILIASMSINDLGKFTGYRNNFSFSWLVAIAIPTALVSLLGLLFTGEFSASLRWLFEICLQAAGAVGSFLLWLGKCVLHWLSGTPHPRAPSLPFYQMPSYPRRESMLNRFFAPQDLSGSVMTLTVSTAVLIILTVAIFAALMIGGRKQKRELPIPVEEERISVWSWDLLWNQIRTILVRFVRGLQHEPARTGPPIAARAAANGVVDLSEIRRIYRRFLGWAASHKSPRLPAQTPLEHIHAICEQTTSIPLLTIVESYQDTRYGNIPASCAEIERAREALDVLEKSSKMEPPSRMSSS